MEDSMTTTKTVINQPLTNTQITKEVVSTQSSDLLFSKIDQIIWFFIGLIEILIIARFVLLLLGAKNTEFVATIYSAAKLFILPFTGIFTSPTYNGSYFDSAAVVGMIAWLVFGFIVTYFISIFNKKEV